MEQLSARLGDVELFDQLNQTGLLDGGDLMIVTKDAGTVSGKPAIMLTFSVQLPNGRLTVARTVTTLYLLSNAVRALEARYGPPG